MGLFGPKGTDPLIPQPGHVKRLISPHWQTYIVRRAGPKPALQEANMRAMTAALAFAGLIGIAATSAPARAHDFDEGKGWHRREWREHQWHEQRWREHEWREHARERYAAPPVVYAPPGYYVGRRTYYAPPAYYAPPPPTYYASPGVTIGLWFGVR